jgi:hypothetical protein
MYNQWLPFRNKKNINFSLANYSFYESPFKMQNFKIWYRGVRILDYWCGLCQNHECDKLGYESLTHTHIYTHIAFY